MLNRRTALGIVGGTIAASAVSSLAAEDSLPDNRSSLHLIGTGGGPVLGGERRMACNAITFGGKTYVIDCGYGAAQALAGVGITLNSISSIFITHNHGDHMLDLGPLLFLIWLQGRKDKLDIYGAQPLQSVTEHLLAANQVPLDYYRIDMAMNGMPEISVHELDHSGVILDDGSIRVTCAMVIHPPVLPSFAYRFDLPDRSIVFSGDTAQSDALVELAQGADILVHEATMVDGMLRMMAGSGGGNSSDGAAQPQGYDAEKFREHVLMAHTATEDAGRIASRSRVKTLVLNHLAPGSSTMVSDGAWIEAARRHFSGQIIVAHDNMVL